MAKRAERAGLERADRALDRRGRHAQRVIRIAPGVEDLHRDLAAGLVHGVRHDAVLGDLPGKRELRGAGLEAAGQVRRDAARDDQADAAARTRRVERGELAEAVGLLLEARVHRAHQHAVAQRREAEVQRGKQRRVGVHARSPQWKPVELTGGFWRGSSSRRAADSAARSPPRDQACCSAPTLTPSSRMRRVSATRLRHCPAARRISVASRVASSSVRSRVTVWKLSKRSLMPMVRPA